MTPQRAVMLFLVFAAAMVAVSVAGAGNGLDEGELVAVICFGALLAVAVLRGRRPG